MKRCPFSFNIYFAFWSLCLGLVLGLTGGCASETDQQKTEKKEQSTIRLYLEGAKADSMTSGAVLVTRKRFLYTVEREPFLNEGDLSTASIVDDPSGDGSFYIQLVFDEHASLILDMMTGSNKGKHVIVFAQFPEPGKKEKSKKKKGSDDSDLVEQMPSAQATAKGPRESAWLAAVLIRTRISNGVFRFTPDCSRAEGLRIVRGLRNVLKKKKESDKF